jgi:hypothetical protein
MSRKVHTQTQPNELAAALLLTLHMLSQGEHSRTHWSLLSAGTPTSQSKLAGGHLSQHPPSVHIARICIKTGYNQFIHLHIYLHRNNMHLESWNASYTSHLPDVSLILLRPNLTDQALPSSSWINSRVRNS